jgi:hypothetical protein
VARLPSHERAIFLVVPRDVSVADAIRTVLHHAEVRAWRFPPLWELSFGAIDPLRDLPGVSSVDLASLDALVAYAARVGTPDAFRAYAEREWREIPGGVREFWLRRGGFAVFASLFGVGRRNADVPPPDAFLADRRSAASLDVEVRLHVVPGSRTDPVAPAEEGTLVVPLFDVRDRGARAEAGLPPDGPEALVEVFAYEAGRARFRRLLEGVAVAIGGRVLDPEER